ncbi:hypothetical protein JCM10914A_30630 [Paenibacillus sp. JCM 10914]
MFNCPICGNSMKVEQSVSLVCEKQHCYDISKQGYVNMLFHTTKTKYDRALFESRNIISRSGFFDPMLEGISNRILQAQGADRGGELKILDAGCGEGSHLMEVVSQLEERQSSHKVLGVGVDIAKEGIVMASKAGADQVWCVADLAHSPFADRQFDFIMNILSPSNYAEFRRLLADDGMVIKVIPGDDYLQELRKMFYSQTSKESYSNDHTMELFSRHYERIDSERIQYRVVLDSKRMNHLINMTPLSWGASPETCEQTMGDEMEVTVDFTVLYGWN